MEARNILNGRTRWRRCLKIMVVLEDNGLKEFIDSDVPKPTSTDGALLDAWKNKVVKARRILLEGV